MHMAGPSCLAVVGGVLGAKKIPAQSAEPLTLKDHCFININHVLVIPHARHMLEFTMKAVPGSTWGPGVDQFQMPAALMALLKPPSWGQCTFTNTVGATLLCFV